MIKLPFHGIMDSREYVLPVAVFPFDGGIVMSVIQGLLFCFLLANGVRAELPVKQVLTLGVAMRSLPPPKRRH
jgi:hypothetical protein